MPLTRYKKFCYRVFGSSAEKRASDRLKDDLVKANMDIRAGAYLAYTWMNTILSIAVTAVALPIIIFIILPLAGIRLLELSLPNDLNSLLAFLLLFLAPPGVGALVYFAHITLPKRRAKWRGKRIDYLLPYALNFISAMSAAGIAPHEIFISLSKQKIYGEVKEEAARIAKDMKLLGMDIITALKKAMERTPSQRFKDFLQGAVVTVTSGGTLKPYFMAKADQYMRENRVLQEKFIEDLGVMAETYVIAAVVLPLLLLVILPIMMMTMGGHEYIFILYIIVFIVLPIIHAAFIVGIKSMTMEVIQ